MNSIDHEMNNVSLSQSQDSILSDPNVSVRVSNIVKYYGTTCILNNINIKIGLNECVGIIGPNGAGKTTLLSIMTKLLRPTSGLVVTEGQLKGKHSKLIGYCPQFDALIELLTVRETLTSFAKICGYTSTDKVVEQLILAVDLQKHSEKQTKALSGGNKRKLNVAIAALIGRNLVILDEPTCGVDPTSRQTLWLFISALIKSGKSILLTSHSMDECEALCNSIHLMLNGKIKISGTIQELKMTFGRYYLLYVKVYHQNTIQQQPSTIDVVKRVVKSENNEQFKLIDKLENFIFNLFTGSIVLQRKLNYITFQIDKSATTINNLFRILNDHRSQLQIENFFVSQESLEQIFDRLVSTSL